MRLTRLGAVSLASGNVPVAELRDGGAVTPTSDSDVHEVLTKILAQLETQTELLERLR